MKIIKSYLTNNECYIRNKPMTVKGLMLHSVGCPQPSAKVFVNAWNKPKVYKCVHAFIQSNGEIYQTLDWNVQGWHGGKSYSNKHYIGIEMCEPTTLKYNGLKIIDTNPNVSKEHVLKTYDNAVQLFAHLCEKYNLNPLTDIISHYEGYWKGIASNHGDPEHLWKLYGLTMDMFRKDVNRALKTAKFESFIVRVISNNLNVRKEPKIEKNNVICQVHKGDAFTIIEVVNGFGKLKSGVGWIKITDKYCQRVDDLSTSVDND